jgi:Ca-activated chloride channel family protein
MGKEKEMFKIQRNRQLRILLLCLVLCFAPILAACSGSKSSSGAAGADFTANHGGKVTLRVLSGSENKELEDILDDFAKEKKINIAMYYKGSLDIMRALQADQIDYDAVWPANSMWITAGDVNHLVKDTQSVSLSPVIFGIRRSLAEELGFVGNDVYVRDILQAIQEGKLRFCMTSATQSNSGCCAYIGFLNALLGNPDTITSEDLQSDTLKEQLSELLAGVERSSGSSDWLKEMFLAGDYDAMVNYECLIIAANRELESEGKETLYAVYPVDGLTYADSPLGYIDQGDDSKQEAFSTFQEYLLTDEVQDRIQKTGRRGRYNTVSADNQDVFNTDWGIDTTKNLTSIKMPESSVLFEALNLYQAGGIRKPSLTVYCLDYSGSMYGEGEAQLEEAMSQILIQDNAQKNYLQAGPDDVNIVIPFDRYPRGTYTAVGNGSEIESLNSKVSAEDAVGGTNIYRAMEQAFSELENYDITQYTAAVVLMTDGMSDTESGFWDYYLRNGQDIPVFSIMFGDSDPDQLNEIADKTNARVFDGTKDLVSAFRAVKGYN